MDKQKQFAKILASFALIITVPVLLGEYILFDSLNKSVGATAQACKTPVIVQTVAPTATPSATPVPTIRYTAPVVPTVGK